MGESQSAFALTTFVNVVHPELPVFGGFLLHSRGGAAMPLGEPDAPVDPRAYRGAAPAPIRDDLDIPVFVLNSESEATLHHPVRQPDTDRYRYWEVAGVAHGPRERGTPRLPSPWPRDLGTDQSRIGTPPDANVLRLDDVRASVLRHVQRWLVDGGPATVGVIASVTRSFCGACDRTRLTADGQVRNCLFAREESDLRTPLREGATDQELADRWRIATLGKLPGHGIDDPSFLQPSRPMSAIGG